MNTRSIALIANFAALAIVLNAIRIPTFYWPGFYYTLYEIPVLVVFLIYGFKIGILVEAIHIAGQEIFFPVGPGGLVVYPMGLIVMPLMALTIFLVQKFLTKNPQTDRQKSERKKTIYVTGAAAVVRGGFMPILDSLVLYSFLLPIVLGRSIPAAYVAGLVPGFIIYNVTSALYAVPIAYFIAKQACKHLKLEPRLLKI